MVVQVVQRVTAAPTTQQLAIAHNNVVDFLTGSKSPTLFKVLNVGATTNAVDTGDGWLAGGLSLGTYSNPGVGQLTMSGQLISSLATGTAPFTVASTTLVPNLNASKLNSAAASATPTASTIPIADGSGKLDIGWIPAAVGSGTYLPLAGGTMGGSVFFSATNSFDIGDATRKPRSIYLGTSLGVGITPTKPLHVSVAAAADWVAAILQTDTGASSKGLSVDSASTSTTAPAFEVSISGTPALDVFGTGYVKAASRIGVAVTPTYPLHISAANASNFLAFLDQTSSTDGTFLLGLNHASTGTSSSFLTMVANSVLRFKFFVTGGLTLGSAADQGAGTINVTGNVYKNALAYNSPDYVFEHAYTGKIEKYAANDGAADYPGLISLEAVEAFAREHWHLPRIPHDAPAGIFDRADASLEHIESLYLHLFAMNRRLLALEGAAPVRAA